MRFEKRRLPLLLSRRHSTRSNIVTRCHVVWFDLFRIEMINRDDALRQCLHLFQQITFRSGQHAFGHSVTDPIDAVIAAHHALSDRAFELSFGLLGGHDLLERDFENAGRVIRIAGDENLAREAIANLAGLGRETYTLRGQPVRGRTVGVAEGKYSQPQDDAHDGIREIVAPLSACWHR